MSYISTLYGTSQYTNNLKDKTTSTQSQQTSGSSFTDLLQSKTVSQGWSTPQEQSPEKIFENQTSSIKDAYKNSSVSAMLDNARTVYENLKTQVASQNIQIKPTPTLTSILSKI